MAIRQAAIMPKANHDEIVAHRATIQRLVNALGLSNPRLRADGTVVVHSSEPGYRAVARLSAMASAELAKDVHVITDDVPGAIDLQEL